MLNEEEVYLSSKYCFRIGRFSSIGLHGSLGGSVGGRVLLGQEHGFSPGVTTPEFVQVGMVDLEVLLAATSHMAGMRGKLSATTPNAFSVPRERYVLATLLAT